MTVYGYNAVLCVCDMCVSSVCVSNCVFEYVCMPVYRYNAVLCVCDMCVSSVCVYLTVCLSMYVCQYTGIMWYYVCVICV